MTVSLYPHQKDAIEELRSGSILCGGVGSGKSRTAIAYYFCKECKGGIGSDGELSSMKEPKDLYIITTARKRDTDDWEWELIPFLLSTKEKSYWNVKVVVDSWNNVTKYVDVENSFFIFDEQRIVGSGVWVKSFLKIAKKNRWLLLSATPGDTWMDYVPVFIANGFYKNRTEFIHRHVVYSRFAKFPKVDRYIDTRRLERFRKRIMVNMEFARHTVRHTRDVLVEYNKTNFDRVSKDRWNIFEGCPIRDISEACFAMRKVVNTDQSRIEAVSELIDKNPKTIIFYNFDYELILLRSLMDSKKIVYSEWNGHKHELVPIGDRWAYLVQYTAGAEGWNCVETNVIIFYSLNYSYKIMEQAFGRIDRMNTPYIDLYYYRIRSRAPIDRSIFQCLKNKKKFNEKAFAKETGLA